MFEIRDCPACGERVGSPSRQAVVCPMCGTALEHRPVLQRRDNPPSDRMAAAGVLVLLLMVLTLVALFTLSVWLAP